MTSHNPLRPKSSLLEQKAKSRSGLQMVMIIVAVHVVFLGGLLFSGCRPENPAPEPAPGPDAIPVLPPDGGGVASPPGETNTVTVVEAPAAPPLPGAPISEPKPPPVTRDTEPVEDIVPLIPEPSEGPEVPVAAGEIGVGRDTLLRFIRGEITPQQAALGLVVKLKRIIFWTTYSAQKHCINLLRFGHGRIRQRRSVRVISDAANQIFAHIKIQIPFFTKPADDLANLGHYFGANPVAGKNKKRWGAH